MLLKCEVPIAPGAMSAPVIEPSWTFAPVINGLAATAVPPSATNSAR
jgi:hypothetical protein